MYISVSLSLYIYIYIYIYIYVFVGRSSPPSAPRASTSGSWRARGWGRPGARNSLSLSRSSLRRGHANLLWIVPILTDDPRRESDCYCYLCYVVVLIFIIMRTSVCPGARKILRRGGGHWFLEGTMGSQGTGGRKQQLVWLYFALNSLHGQTLMLTDAQTSSSQDSQRSARFGMALARFAAWGPTLMAGPGMATLRGTKSVPRKGVGTSVASVNMRVWTCKESRAKHNQTSCYLRRFAACGRMLVAGPGIWVAPLV